MHKLGAQEISNPIGLRQIAGACEADIPLCEQPQNRAKNEIPAKAPTLPQEKAKSR